MSRPAWHGGWEDSSAGVTGLVGIPDQSGCQAALLQPQGCSSCTSLGHGSSRVPATRTFLGCLRSKAGPHRRGSRFSLMKGSVLAHGQWKASGASERAGKSIYQRWVRLWVSLGDWPSSTAQLPHFRCLRKAKWKDRRALRQPPAMCAGGQCTALPQA